MGSLEPDPGNHREPHPADLPLLAVEITRRGSRWEGLKEGLLVRAAQAAFAGGREKGSASEVSLLLTDDEEIAGLNKTWRNRDGATNVLSFRLGAPHCNDGPTVLGDVVLARETVVREAAARGIPAGQHAAHLVVHGVLHLMGYDHASDREAGEMEDLEMRILAKLGIPGPYSSQTVANGEGQ